MGERASELHGGNGSGGGDGSEGKSGGGCGRREGGGRIEKGPPCATDGRAKGGHAQTARASAWCPFHPKSGANLGRGWVESGHKADKSPFTAAHWAVSFVHFIPNGRGRTR